MIRWSDDPDGRAADRILVLVAYLLGLGYANHMARHARRAGGRPRGAHPPAADAAPLEAAAGVHRGAALRHHAVRHAAHPRGAPPGDQRGRADRLPRRAACRLHVQRGTYDAFMYNFNRGQYGKPELSRAPGAVQRAARHVVVLLQVAVAARRAPRARRAQQSFLAVDLLRARALRRLGALQDGTDEASGTSAR